MAVIRGGAQVGVVDDHLLQLRPTGPTPAETVRMGSNDAEGRHLEAGNHN